MSRDGKGGTPSFTPPQEFVRMKHTATKQHAILQKLKLCAKALARVPVLASALLLANSSAPAANVAQTKKSINERVELVRDTLKRKAMNDQSPANNLSYSERALAQWNNWGNWGNWNNWANWANWNNWKNWGNWGNWGNV